MTFRDVTRAVIKRVEVESGCPVVVSEDRGLKTLSASRIARGENRFHSIAFNPSAGTAFIFCNGTMRFSAPPCGSPKRPAESIESILT